MTDLNQKIIEQYHKVFDEKCEITPCGRNECMKLMNLLRLRFPEVNFGDERTGFMNTENIHEYIKKI